MSDEIIKVKGNNIINLDQKSVGVFGEENIRKFNNAIIKMEEEVLANPGLMVRFIASNKHAALYAVAHRSCNSLSPKTDAIYYRYKTKEWTATIIRATFTQEFVRKYLKSVYWMKCVSELDVVREIALFEASHGYSCSGFGKYLVSCSVGGLVLATITPDDYVHYLDFISYEELDSEKIKSFYGDLLHHYASASCDGFQDLVPRELLIELIGLRPVIDEYGEIRDFERVENKQERR